jgi:hypothetical protein
VADPLELGDALDVDVVLEADAKSQGLELDIRFLDITDHAAVNSVVNAVATDYGQEVATIIVALLNADEPPLRVQSSPWATEFVGAKLADRDGSGTVKALDGYLRLGD